MAKDTTELTVSHKSTAKSYTPCINIAGEWLKELGFNFGDKVKVEKRNGQILIQKING